MKYQISLILLFCVCSYHKGITQSSKLSSNGISAKVLLIDYGNPNGESDLKITNGLELAYHRDFNRYLGLSFPLKLGVANVVGSLDNVNVLSIDALLRLKLAAEGKKLSPYLLGGAGIVWQDAKDNNAQVPLGLGLNFFLGKGSNLNMQAEYRLSSAENRNNLQLGLGYLYRFGKLDSDGDGIVDHQDGCPTLPGQAALDGCPDSDNDGVIDPKDQCPAVSGAKELEGCPDKDGDGVADKNDSCPDVAGKLNGCTDSDLDGVADKEDKCPDKAGPKKSMGCPDTDGDGLFDHEDNCPDQAGQFENKGCPPADRDADGVPDTKDLCPDDPSPGHENGCPDTDGDGVYDLEDVCPNTAGPANNKGCPELKQEAKETLQFAMKNVQFETGNAILLEESFKILDRVVTLMKEYEGYKLRISGHTDNTGDPASNQQLSEERAGACFGYLKWKGIDPTRMQHAGFGQNAPVADNNTAEGRRLNRRVEFDMFIE